MIFDNWPWQNWLTHRADKCAIIVGQQQISWQQLTADIDSQADCFYTQGVREDLTVALRGKNSYALLIDYLAILQLGARVLPLNPQIPSAQLTQLISDLDIQLVSDHGDDKRMSEFDDITILCEQLDDVSQLSTNHYYHQNRVCWSGQRPATMTLTSGSSGIPKAVVHSLSAHLENAEGLLQSMTFEYGDSWLLSLPIFHVSGQGIIWRWLLKGATLVIRDMQSLAQALANCSHASLVPTQLWRLLSQTESQTEQQTKVQRLQPLSLRQVLLGGAAITTELTQQAQQRGISCWCGYGLTEFASTVCAKQANDSKGVGQPLPNRQVKIEQQQIYLKGAGLALGYWQNSQIVPIVDQQGWFATRDKGRIVDGELYVLGRLDNLFFSGGEGIQPEDIESILMTHPLIEQAFIVPIDDSEFGQRPVAIIQSKEPLNLAQILSWLDGKVARFQLPIACYLLPDHLKSHGIKVSRRSLANWLARQG